MHGPGRGGHVHGRPQARRQRQPRLVLLCPPGCAGGAAFHDILSEGRGAEHIGEEREARLDGVDRVEGKLLVLLHILVVGEGQPLHRREHRHEVAIDSARLATGKLRDVRVLLLRHEA